MEIGPILDSSVTFLGTQLYIIIIQGTIFETESSQPVKMINNILITDAKLEETMRKDTGKLNGKLTRKIIKSKFMRRSRIS
jgi:hypothetical protein